MNGVWMQDYNIKVCRLNKHENLPFNLPFLWNLFSFHFHSFFLYQPKPVISQLFISLHQLLYSLYTLFLMLLLILITKTCFRPIFSFTILHSFSFQLSFHKPKPFFGGYLKGGSDRWVFWFLFLLQLFLFNCPTI